MTSKYYINGDNVYNLEEVELILKETFPEYNICIYMCNRVCKIKCKTKEEMDNEYKNICTQMFDYEKEMRHGE